MCPTHLLSRPCSHRLLVARLPPLSAPLEDKDEGCSRQRGRLLGDVLRGPQYAGFTRDGVVSIARVRTGARRTQGLLCGERGCGPGNPARGQQRKAGSGLPAQLGCVGSDGAVQEQLGVRSTLCCGTSGESPKPPSLRLLACNYMQRRQNYLKSIHFYLKKKKKDTEPKHGALYNGNSSVTPGLLRGRLLGLGSPEPELVFAG